jgi:tetratricopeptide (TPR) repeat protein
VEARLKKALQARGISDASKWQPDTEGGLDAALAETATLAADDVLLNELLQQLEAAPLARKLLFGVAVYRVPVDRVGLAYHVGKIVERPVDPERQQRMARVNKALKEAKAAEGKPDLAAFGLSQTDISQYMQDLQAVMAPPVEEPEGLDEAIADLESLSLLSPVQYADGEATHHFVHRWTARALAEPGRASAKELADAHQHAAAYWRWRVDSLPQSQQQDIEDVLEARHHYHAAGDLDEADVVHQYACLQLETWGAWQREERLIHEMLAWLPEGSLKAAKHLHQLGILARGDYDQALDWYRKSLEINEALGNRAGVASSYHQLGMVAHERGDYDQALDWYRKSLEIKEALGDRAFMASSYMGSLAISLLIAATTTRP